MIELTNREVTDEEQILIDTVRDDIQAMQRKQDEMFENLAKALSIVATDSDEERVYNYDILFDYVYNNVFIEAIKNEEEK
jgi:membrane-bound lytic murein transglycosylase MltF